MPEVPDTVDDAIEPLTSPSTDEVFEATRPFSAREIASAAASEALSGGGDPFNGGTITEELVIDADSPIVNAALHVQTDGDVGASPLLLDASVEGEQMGQFEFQPEGRILMTSYTAGGDEARIELVDTTPGNEGQLQFSTYSGITMTLEGSSQKSIWVVPKSTQSGDLLNIYGKDSSESVVVDAVGHLRILRHAAPSDASLVAGELAFWFDQTNGAAKLKLKGKSADGTVVQGEVALS